MMRSRQTASFAFAIAWLAGLGAHAQGVDEKDLRQTEMSVVRSVSRSVFGAQKAERSQAKKAGMRALGQDLKRLQALLRDRPILHVGNARIDLVGGIRAAEGADVGGSARSSGSGGGAVGAVEGRLSGLRVDRVASFERAHGDVLADKETLRRNLSLLRAPNQRAVAEALLERLDGMEAMLVDAATELAAGAPQGRSTMDALSREIRPRESTRPRQGMPPLEPTMTTRIRHRREIPHVP